jgi:hypothetical protein
MSTPLLVVIVIVIIAVVAAGAYVAWKQSQRRGLQERFGPEYDRAVESHESRREAEQELLARQKRHEELDIRPLDLETRERHRVQWRLVQERFVDAPGTAVVEADQLLNLVMGERGYPTEGYEQQAADLSVEHAATIDRYRTAHDISERAGNDQASTEDLRQAMVHYRALFSELIGLDEETVSGTDEGAATARSADVAEAEAGTVAGDTAEAESVRTGEAGTRDRSTEPETARATEAGTVTGRSTAAETARTDETAVPPTETTEAGTVPPGETAGAETVPAAENETARAGEAADVEVARPSDATAAGTAAKRPARARSTRSRAADSATATAGDAGTAETAGTASTSASKPRRRTKAATATDENAAEAPAETPAATAARRRRRPATKQEGEDAEA